MNILLTNDDGVYAKGLNTLFNVLSKEHNVFIIAPDQEKSGTSNAMTFKTNFHIKNISENIYALAGFPADCVNIGIRGDIIPKVDLVISGINHGPNLGDDIYFSGTLGGARVACIMGIPGIAVSINCNGESEYFQDASVFMLNYIDNLFLTFGDRCIFLNINYPDLPGSRILGIKYPNLGKRIYNDNYKVINNENNEIKLQYNFGNLMNITNDNGSDISELEKGYITITPLTLDCTDYELIKNINNNI
ncbi:MAG: 5'/3'-nucleotidase SurE [Spirochaetes bacterium]|nr:5'/3'-nucleotidase SurE [Spirochaetota bacterium]